MTTKFRSFRGDIEGLRALAVILVVLFHADHRLIPGGFIGVDIFFVISGYLITGLLFAEFEETKRISFSAFYARRGRRLLPAAALVVLFSLIVIAFTYSPPEQSLFAKSAAFASAYVSNIFFSLQPTDYFSVSMKENPFLHTWSLAVEEQFYFLWPLFMFVCLKMEKSRQQLCVLLAGVTAVSFAFCVWMMEVNQTWAFYGLPSRVWEFSIGGLARLLIQRPEFLRPATRKIIGATSFLVILASAFLITDQMVFPGWTAVPAVLATCVLLAVGGNGSGVHAIFVNPLAQWLGQRSYGIYLWHWPLLQFFSVWFPEAGFVTAIAAIALTLVLAHASYHLLENPIRHNDWLKLKSSRSIRLGVSLTVFSIVVATSALFNAAQIADQSHHKRLAAAARTLPPGIDARCFVWPPQSSRFEMCEYGDTSSEDVIILFGDSHARQWFTPIDQLAKRHGLKLITVLKASCSAADIRVYSEYLKRENQACAEWRETAIEEILAIKPRFVIIGAFSPRYVENFDRLYTQTRSFEQQWASGLAKTVSRFDQLEIETLYLQHTPRFKHNVPTCLGRTAVSSQSNAICNRPRSKAVSKSLHRIELERLSELPNAKLANWTDAFCDAETCFAERDGEILMRDSHHVSEAFARTFLPKFETALGLSQ